MGCIPAPAAKAMLAEASRIAPGRRRASDGICGDPAHQARQSRHNTGDAADLTHDPAAGIDCNVLTEQVRERCIDGDETRCDEIIWNGRICTAARDWHWRPYGGANPHDKHAHFSIRPERRNDTSPWFTRPDSEELAMDAEAKAAFADLVNRLNAANHEIRQVRQEVANLTAKLDKSHPGSK